MSLNFDTVLFLVNSSARAMGCAYEPAAPHQDKKSRKTELFKTLDPTLKEGDLVLVETSVRHGMSVFEIVSADVEIDIASQGPMKWIVGKAPDRNAVSNLKAKEGDMIAAIRQKDKERQRAELAETMRKDYGEEFLKGMALAKPAEVPQVDHQKE
jgi:hypothetical protein